jgi:hypothetical protein
MKALKKAVSLGFHHTKTVAAPEFFVAMRNQTMASPNSSGAVQRHLLSIVIGIKRITVDCAIVLTPKCQRGSESVAISGVILTIKAVHPNDIEIYITDDVEEDNTLTVHFGGERHLHYDGWIDEKGDTPRSRHEYEMDQLELMANAIVYEIVEKRKRS